MADHEFVTELPWAMARGISKNAHRKIFCSIFYVAHRPMSPFSFLDSSCTT